MKIIANEMPPASSHSPALVGHYVEEDDREPLMLGVEESTQDVDFRNISNVYQLGSCRTHHRLVFKRIVL